MEDSHSNYGFVFQVALAFFAPWVGAIGPWRKNRNDGADVLAIDFDDAYQGVGLAGTVADCVPQAHGDRRLAPNLGGTRRMRRKHLSCTSRVTDAAGTSLNATSVSLSVHLRPDLRVALLALGLLLPVYAAGQPAASGSGWLGTLGIGPVAFPKYVGGKELQVLPLPIAYFTYEDWFYVNLYRAGAYVWGSEDKKRGISLSVEPRLGFHGHDGPRLEGMATRRNSLSAGPTFDWQSGRTAFSLGYFTDLSRASGGGYADLFLNRTVVHDDRWDASLSVEVTRLDSKIVDYYFGVPASEATPTRPEYQPGASTNVTLWITGQYNLTKREALMFGSNLMRLGAAAADSPIVERRLVPLFYLGIGLIL